MPAKPSPTETEPPRSPTERSTSTPRPSPTPTPTNAPVTWELAWADEFDEEGLPDPSRWDYEQGFIRNNEAQYYTQSRLENARLEGGNLVIEARKELHLEAQYTSASLVTRGKAEWTYGRIEVRAQLPTGRGTWPAIWMLGVNIDQVGWPACGEIDIMENVGFDPDKIHANVHTEAYNHVKKTNKGASLSVESPYENFHVYAVDWFPDHLDFYVDDLKYFTFWNENSGPATWPFDQPHYLILNLAIGGSWGGMQGIDDAIFPQQFRIDYVRVYQAAP
jgi:beta-glucanase (GH16 family)